MFGLMFVCWFFRSRGSKKEDSPRQWWYFYLRYPFDVPNYFCVDAGSREEANPLAMEKFKELFESGQTCMDCFTPCEPNDPKLHTEKARQEGRLIW
jgi:hypothetical protein